MDGDEILHPDGRVTTWTAPQWPGAAASCRGGDGRGGDEVMLPENYISEDDRVTGRLTVKRYSAFDTDDLFEIILESGNMAWTTRVNRVAARQIHDAFASWLENEQEPPMTPRTDPATPEERTTMNERDDQDAGVTARTPSDVAFDIVHSLGIGTGPELRSAFRAALAGAGLVIVDAEVLACLIDAAEEYAAGQAARQPVTMHDRADIDYEVRTITAAVSHARTAVAPGAEDAR